MGQSYFAQLTQGIRTAVNEFAWRSPQTHTTLRAALACTLAAFLAMWLQADQPYWACISAFIVVQTFVGNTLQKAIMRFIGTVLGAVLGLIIASVFSQQHFMVYLCLFVSCFVGIYLSCVDKKHMYVWLLCYITLMMVVFGGMVDPSSEHFISLAFNRSLEVTIGIVASLLVTYFVLPRHAKHTLQQETVSVAQEIASLLTLLVRLYERHDANDHAHIEQHARDVITHIERCQTLWQMGAHEGEQNAAQHHFQDVALITRLGTLFDLLLDQHRALAVYPNNAYLALLSKVLAPCLYDVTRCFALLMEDISHHHTAPKQVQLACEQFELHWQDLVAFAEQQRQLGQSLAMDMAEVDAGFQALVTLRMMVLEIKSVASPVLPGTSLLLPWRQRIEHAVSRVLQYDSFYLKHACLGACALLFMPMIWLFLNLPGFAQIAVSIGAVIGIDPENTRYKGFLRMMGCGVGLVAALCMLALDMQSLGCLLLVVFVSTLVFAYFHYDKPQVSYFGTQALVVFFVGTVVSLAPTTGMTIATERLAAIIMGVGSIVLFQQVFWRFRGAARCRHNIRQFKCAAKPILKMLQHHLLRGIEYEVNIEQGFGEMRMTVRNIQGKNAVVFPWMRDLFYCLYFFVTLVQKSEHITVLMQIEPALLGAIEQLCTILITPYFTVQQKDQALTNIMALEAQFVSLRERLRQRKLMQHHAIGEAFEALTLLSTLRRIVDIQKQVL